MVDNKVRERRKELGITLEQLGAASGALFSTIVEIKKGMEVEIVTAQRIADALNRTTDELWPR